jgi:hypothetical protein
MRWLFVVAAGLAGVGVGLWEGSRLVRDLVYQAQGKCDYLSCTTPSTLPFLAGAVVLVITGAVLVAWSVCLGRRRFSDASPKATI